MKAIFNIAENVRNSRSINALGVLKKLHGLGLLLCTLLFGSLQMWGTDYTYTFTDKYWTESNGYWVSDTDGDGFSNGIQILGSSQAEAHCCATFTGISKVRVYYHTNAKSGAGNLYVKVGSGSYSSKSVSKPSSGGTTSKYFDWTYSSGSGAVYVKGTASANSVYIEKVVVTATSINTSGCGGGGGSSYTIYYSGSTYVTGSGSVSVDATDDEAEEDDVVTITATPSSASYYISSIDAYDESWDAISLAQVDETHYTFTMPTSDVYIFTVFSALPSYSITYNVPTCVTSPTGTLTSQARFATPSEAVPGYRFEGWVASAIPGTTGSKPSTIYQPGEVIPNNNMTVHALYSQVSATFTKQTGSTMPVDGGNYMLCNSYSATARVIKNAVDASKRATTKAWDCSGTTTTCTDWECIWVFKQGTGAYSGYWFIYNPQVGKYLGANSATAHASSPANYEVKLIDGMSDASAWTCTVASGRITLVNKLRSGTSGTNETKLMSSSNYAGFGYSSGTAPYFFKNDAVSASYTTNPSCPGLHVTYDANTPDASVANMPTDDNTYDENDYVSIPNTTPTRTGYTFDKWFTNAGCTTPVGGYAVNTSNAFQITADVTLYAHWDVNPYRVDVGSPSHVTIGVSSPTTIAEGGYNNVNFGATVTLSESSLDAGYAAVWKVYKTGDESTTVSVSGSGNGATFTMPAYPVTVTKTITAPWIYFTSCSSVLTVTYNANGGTGNVPVDANEYAKNDNVTVLGNVGTPSTLSKDGYTFGGWQAGGVGDVYEAGDSYTITSNTTFYAVWTPNNYKITSISTDPASSGTVTAEYNSAAVVANVTEIPCGSEVMLSQEANRDKTFTSWTIKNASTSADVTATYLAGNTLTMPPFNCTVTANYSAKSSCVVTFSLQSGTISTTTIGGTDYTTAVTLYDGESITTLPTVSSISCGDWGTVVGWTTNSSYSQSTTPPAYITAPYNPGSNTTVYAVYRKTDGSADFDGTNDGTYYVLSKTYYASSCFSGFSDETTTTTSQASATPFTFTKNGDYYNISCSEGYYIKYSYGVTDDPSGDDAKWTPVKANENGGSYSSGTEYWYFTNKGTTNKAFAYESKAYYPMQLISASTSYYSINPVCGTTYTITKGTCTPGSSVLDADNDYCDFTLSTSSVSSGGMVTITLTPNKDYTYNASTVTITGGGSASIGNITETAGVITCNITGITADMTVNVTYVARPLYSVTLYDNGVLRTTLTEEHYNTGVTLPSGNNCTPGSSFTFEGWTESAVELNADPVRPATLHAAGSYVPTSDITLYSVYSKSVDGCDDFAAGVSGAYKMYNKATSDYALTTGGSSSAYGKGSSGTAEIFYIAYAPAYTAYTIRTSAGYLGWEGTGSSTALTKTNTTPYYWLITEGTSGNAGYWNFQPISESGRQFSGNNTTFQIHTNSTKYYIRLEKVAMTYYYSTAICEGSQITFHDGGGSISGTPTTPTGASWNSGTHILSGLEDCDKITTFPAASYDGWTFIGWSTEDYSNSGKHTADHAEENASTDEPDGSIIYKTGGNPYVVRGGSIDLYPIFTRFPENEPFNTESGGDYYIYYLKPGTDDGYGAPIRVYAGEYSSSIRYTHTTSCASATEFTFTKDGDIWHIYDKNTGKYLAGVSGGDNLLHRDDLTGNYDDWTITLRSGNQFSASCQDGNRRYISFSTSANYFMDYDIVANNVCIPVYLGTCTERIFSSEPNPTPTIDLTGSPMVTSSAGERVRATATMTLNAAHLSSVPANRVKISGTNLKFAKTAAENPSTDLYVDLVSGSVTQTIYVYYTPAGGDTEDGIENIIVTAQAYNTTTPKEVTTTGTVQVRHLPADFVIAAKWGDKWYALPNTCTSSGSNTTGVQIDVNDADAPTAVTSAPSTAKWGLRQTKAGSRSDGSYTDRLVFTERGTTATPNSQQALYNYNSAGIYTNATYANYNNTNPERYEWIPVTTDFGDYELTNANDATRHLILRNSDGSFVAQNSDKSYDGKVRLLPATFYEEAPVQILEWKANSVVIMYTGSETSATTQIEGNSPTATQTLASQKLTHGIYELTTSASIGKGSNSCKNLTLAFGSTKKVFEIPVILTGSVTTFSGFDNKDIIIPNGKKLTASTSTKYNYRNIYVYGGGKLDIPANGKLGVNNIILRAGGISTNGSGGSATYGYVYPQVKLASTENFSSTQTNIKYEYITDYDHWYQLCLPFDANYTSITYPQEYYGDNVTAGNSGSWVIKRYDGATRATGNYNAWVDIESDWEKEGDPKTVYAGHGYIFWGAPKKVSVGGAAKERQKWGIQRITMPITAAAAITAETENKTVDGLSSYADVEGNSGKINDQGWNLIGNPYMVNLTGLTSESLKTGKLIHEDDAGGNWTGRWESNGDAFRYITVPSEHFDTYEAVKVTGETVTLTAGKVFFVQMDGANTAVQFDVSKRASLLPALYAAAEPVSVETGIVMSNETKKDEVNFWIKDGKTEAYEYNADYPKTMNQTNFNIYGVHAAGQLSWVAISPEIAEGSMAIGYQVPTAGEYMLSLSETYVSDKIDHVLVTDHEVSPEITTDLMEGSYEFMVNQAETNKTRFTVSIQLKEEAQTPTDIDNVRGDPDKPTKFIYHDKIYILRGGQLYDATGKQVKGGLK